MGKAKPQLVPRAIVESLAPADRTYNRTIKIVYPGGKSAPIPRSRRCDCRSSRIRIHEGRADPVATRFAMRGVLIRLLGELELDVEVQPRAITEQLEALCKLDFQYGEEAMQLTLPLSVLFRGASRMADVDGLAFAAGRSTEIIGQERLVRIKGSELGDNLTVQGIPSWMEWEIVNRKQKEIALRLKIIKAPQERLNRAVLKVTQPGSDECLVSLPITAFYSQE
jgi:hypothetical protein